MQTYSVAETIFYIIITTAQKFLLNTVCLKKSENTKENQLRMCTALTGFTACVDLYHDL